MSFRPLKITMKISQNWSRAYAKFARATKLPVSFLRRVRDQFRESFIAFFEGGMIILGWCKSSGSVTKNQFYAWNLNKQTTFWHKNTTCRAQSEKNFWAQPIGRMESYGDLNGHRLWWPPAGEHLKFHNYVTNRRIIKLFIYLNSSHKARLRKNHVCGQWQVVTFDQWPAFGQLWPLLTTGHFSLTTDMIFS